MGTKLTDKVPGGESITRTRADGRSGDALNWSKVLLERTKQAMQVSGSPLNLAIFRIVVLFTLFNEIDVHTLTWCAQMPRELFTMPAGINLLDAYLPINYPLALFACVVCKIACVTGVLGVFTRTSAGIAAFTGVYALVLSNALGSAVRHDNHIIWFATLLAASRCGDALSVMSLFKSKRPTKPLADTSAYSLPVYFVLILLGIVYFFPGLWKLVSCHYLFADGVKLALHSKWTQLGSVWVPSMRIDKIPLLCQLGGIATITFEMSFLFLILFRRTRVAAALLGIFFHSGTFLFMRIPFLHLQACYVALVDWERVLRTMRLPFKIPEYPTTSGNSRNLAVWAVGTALVVGASAAGILKNGYGWPFACYPTYIKVINSMRSVGMSLTFANGTEVPLYLDDEWRWFSDRKKKTWRIIWPTNRSSGELKRRQLIATWEKLAETHPEWLKAQTVNFYDEVWMTDPDTYEKGPVSRKLVFVHNLHSK